MATFQQHSHAATVAASVFSTAFSISLRDLTLILPDGRPLFDGLSAELQARRVGLVGRNGVGKSLLAQLVAGLITPTAGRVLRRGTLAYVPQTMKADEQASVAGVAGLTPVFDALARVGAGEMNDEDFALLDGRWDTAARLRQALDDGGLGHLDGADPAAHLSGGELTRVALIGAFLSGADGLVLDEPTNHLDAQARRWLLARLALWPGSAVVVSHDRTLLDSMDRIVELSPQGLKNYGGNFSHYAEQREAEADSALAALHHAQVEKKTGLRLLREQQDAQQRRATRHQRAAKSANLSGLLLGRMKDKAQVSSGKGGARRDEAAALLNDALRLSQQRAMPEAAVAMMLPASTVPTGKRVASFDEATPPFPLASQPLSLTLAGPVRLAIHGPNGSGKTTLLKMLAGHVAPLSGRCQVRVRTAWLDQHAHALLPPSLSVLERLQDLQTPLAQGVLRSHLAWLGLKAPQVQMPSGLLSGGERMKAALACALWAREPAQLLLLDEPTNHLDLASVQAIEQALASYAGALVVVSHDVHFLASLKLTHTLSPVGRRWVMDGADQDQPARAL